MTLTPPRDEFFLEPRDVRRSFDRAAASYDKSAAVHAEIRSRLLERLELVRIHPSLVVDLGAGTGVASRALKRRYPRAQVVAMDWSESMLRQAVKRQGWLRRFNSIVTDANALCLRTGCADLVFSNLMLQWCNEPHRVFAEVHRVLKPGGLLTFATVGPDTLAELRAAWRHLDPFTHVHRFIDMHDLGDVLVRCGFVEPVMDTERLTITYSGIETLVQDLRSTGSRNVASGRRRSLHRRNTWQRLRQEMPGPSRISITVEVVYGHAWAGEPRAKRAGGTEFSVPVSALRNRARSF